VVEYCICTGNIAEVGGSIPPVSIELLFLPLTSSDFRNSFHKACSVPPLPCLLTLWCVLSTDRCSLTELESRHLWEDNDGREDPTWMLM
jgi:hypothetical protein